MKEEFKNELEALRLALNVKNDTQLSEKLEISYSAIDAWKRRSTIPKKYKKYIQNKEDNKTCINKSMDFRSEIIELIDELDDKKVEYYFYKIKSDVLESELK